MTEPAEAAIEPGSLGLVPRTFLAKLRLSFSLFARNFPVVGGLVLVICLPCNFLTNYYASINQNVDYKGDLALLNLLATLLFQPITAAGIIYVLSRLASGERVTFFDALSQGMNNWLQLFAARMAALAFILCGLIAMIVPGLIFWVRFALIDSAVVLERARDPRERSAELVRGRHWEIFAALMTFQLLPLPLMLAFDYVPRLNETLKNPWVGCTVASVGDLLAGVATIQLFLYYRELSALKPQKSPSERDALDDGWFGS